MYINTETLEVYKDQNDIRKAFPNTCFPIDLNDDILNSLNIVNVIETPIVYNNILEKVIEVTPVLLNGVWIQQWEIQPKYSTQEEITEALRLELERVKELKNEEINLAREETNQSSFIHNGKEISFDSLSSKDIIFTNGFVSTFNALPDNWPGIWKTKDNDYIPITTVEEWKAFYLSVFKVGSNNFMHSEQLKYRMRQITEPTMESIQAVNAIHW